MKHIRFRKLIVTMTVMFAMLVSPMTVFAADNAQEWLQKNAPEATENGRWGNSQGSKYFKSDATGDYTQAVTIKGSDGNDYTYYCNPNDEDKIKTLIERSDKSDQVQTQMDEMTADLGLEADLGTAIGILSGAIPLANTLLGFIVLVINIGMFLFTGIDMAYILAPQFKERCDDAAQSGNKAVSKTGSNGEPRFRWITDNAVYAIKAANTVETGKNPLWIYGKSRVWTYMILAVMDFILLTGNVTVFMNFALKVADGFLRMIQSV